MVRRGDMPHELRIAKPTIRDQHWRRERHTTLPQGRHAPVEHDLQTVQFVAAWPSSILRAGPTDGQIDGDDQFALADNHNEQHPSIPESTRCSCPLHQVPTGLNCPPYLLNTESSPTQVHCQRLRVASLLPAA